MPLAGFVPSEFEYDYPRWTAPAIGSTDTGKAWAWNHTTGKYEPATFLLSSAVSVYGLTLASAADAAAARTALALGTAATLNVGTSANNVVQLDGSARLPAVDGSQLTGISGGSVAGSNTQVIYNASGAFAGDSGMTYDASTDRLTVAGGIIAGDWSPPSNSTTAVSIWNAARSTRVMAVDTTNGRIAINTDTASHRLTILDVSNSSAVRLHTGTGGFYIRSGAAADGEFSAGYEVVGGSRIARSTAAAGMNFYNGGTYFINHSGLTTDASFSTTYAMIIAASRNISIGLATAGTALLDIAASTTARASFRVRAGTAPTTPNAGDIWYATGDRLKLYRAATETIASGVPGTGGSATAGGTWGATEQSMLQKCYDIVRAFGMLS